MRNDRGTSDDEFDEEPQADGTKPANPRERKSVAEAWSSGRLRQAEKLLERFEREFDELEPRDPNLLRDYYRWTGQPHYRTEFGWSSGRPEDADEDPADVIERVNC